MRGHSYLPPDRVFGHIEKKLRKMPIIKTPAEYHDVYEQFGQVLVYGDDWNVFEYNTLAQSSLKSIACLGMQKNRKWVFSRRYFASVEVSNLYVGDTTRFKMLKPNVTKFIARKPKLMPSKSSVSIAKCDDVMKLIELMELTENERNFCMKELNKPATVKDDVKRPVEKEVNKTSKKQTKNVPHTEI